jgi:hypothetical protein
MSTKFSGPPMPPPMPPICRKPPDSQLPPTAPAQLTLAYSWAGTDPAGNSIADSGICYLFRTSTSPGIQYEGTASPADKPTTILLTGLPNDDNFSITATLQSGTYTWHTAAWTFHWFSPKTNNYFHEEATQNPYEHITLRLTILRAGDEKAPNAL